ncbi:plasmid pRiA4b ORF-3 family protein [Arthrobacter sp. FW306-07-I]|uniref:plasmid pRiA4b ORF-3 family protein n=1 Tax=Arthrobacter sp. FW306-07-I TaxID=2879622 RepID=UPI001F187CD3|nr:plasmid pRiA4b ORF-3 family protein [Arthrobacter sp. FW306-07-I]UKA77607.1 plasmid pRiA4b ORF-3 family protein [Arthrobacter sp. FW306-07-I]
MRAGCTGLSWCPDGPIDKGAPPARLIAGARRGPLEDSGGLPGYEDITDALADPSHPDHDEYSAWVADMTGSCQPFDPAFLDIAAVNRTLATLF